jgi:hypothetical protein
MAKGGRRMATQTEKRLDVVRRLARDLGPGQYITNKGLVEALCNQCPEFRGHRNPIVAADFSANSKSGYSYPKEDCKGKRSRDPILFRRTDNQYIKYDPALQGSWECHLINGEKKVIKTD